MKESIKNRKKKFLALCLSVMMLSSVAAIAACSEDATDSSSSSSSSSASTSEEKDTGLIKNAGFETFNDDNLINTSVTGWGAVAKDSDANGEASSSTAASGILDLSKDAWDDLTTSKYSATTADDAKANWDKMTTKDKLAFYDKWKEENSGKTISSELDFYESFNIDTDDLPTIEHFDTHDGQVVDGGKDTKVLMIHNEKEESGRKAVGTAQKFTSTTPVTVKAGTSAQFSVWVKTKDLQSSSTGGIAQAAVGKGAYISISHSVGSTTLDAYTIENINTEAMGVTDNNGWKQYTFLLKGASYTDTTFTIVLGLGQGGKSYRADYVNGYAFFDDIECKIIDNADCDITSADHIATFESEGDQKIVDLSKNDYSKFALNFYGDEFAADDTVISGVEGTATTGEVGFNKETYSSLKGDTVNKPAFWLNNGGFDGSNDVTKVFDGGIKAAASESDLAKKVFDRYFEEGDTLADKQTLLLLSENGVAYTAKTGDIAIPADTRTAISFFVKTSAMDGKTGAGVTLKSSDGTESSFAAIDTTTADPITIGDVEDYYKGWQQYFFFVENTTEEEATYTLTFHYGPTTIASTSKAADYVEGFATFASFQTKTMVEEEFASAKAGTFAKVHTIAEKEEEESTAASFDNAMGTPSNALKEGLANPNNYKGVYGNDQKITGNHADSSAANTYANAGLINKKYFLEYFDTATYPWLTAIKGSETNAETVWNNVFGKDSTQPLFIFNDGSAELLNHAYGFFGQDTSIAANTYTAVSIRVRGSEGAKAYIRLVDTNADNYNQVLTIGRNLTYWYDDEGNIYNGDPADETKAAFKLQQNGLYQANKNWKGYSELSDAHKSAYFANLKAYEKDADGNLIVAKGGASHDYNDYWNNEGVNGIAFYYNADNNTYYADKAKTIPVLDLSEVTSLTPRYTAINAAEQALEETVTLTGDWQYVTFYIHTGDVAKNYRLEVFSGAKNDEGKLVGNAKDTYVVFDTTNPGTAESNFTGLIEQYGDIEDATLQEKLGWKKIESVFSYFDAATYLRYNANLDENNVGNLYKDNYTASAQTEGIAFLKYVDGAEHNIFADYSYSEKAVTASAADDDTSDDSTEEETESETNIWLLISSLSVAGVLLLAIVSIVVRKIVVKVRKNKTAQKSSKNTKK